MKKLFLLLIFIPVLSFSQSNYKNEIGIGLGSIAKYYNTLTYLDNHLMIEIPFSQSGLPETGFSETRSYIHTIIPEIYYRRCLSRRFDVFASYQYLSTYAYATGAENYDDGPSFLIENEMSVHHKLNSGIAYNLIERKGFDFYLNTDAEFIFEKDHQSGYSAGYYSWGTYSAPHFFNYTYNQLAIRIETGVGAKVNLTPRLNLRYEFSHSAPVRNAFGSLNPVSRLSLDYCF